MTQFKLTIDLNNGDFQANREWAVAEVLKGLAGRLLRGELPTKGYEALLDGNGNECGRAGFR